ncbi:hypothetical protein V6N13_002066 [Hibiscus sabdariffa]
MAATIASKSSFLRPIIRTATKIPFSVPNPSLRSNFTLHQTRISPFSLSRYLSSFLDSFHVGSTRIKHSSTVSQCGCIGLPCFQASSVNRRHFIYLSYKPGEGSESLTSRIFRSKKVKGRFANYLSPI